jgi:fructoselysine-6-P-deglycase FrlB-like protein
MKQIAKIMAREKRVPINIEAAGGALLLDLGFEPEIAHIFIIVGRGPMFAAAYMERLKQRPNPFQKLVVFDEVGAR